MIAAFSSVREHRGLILSISVVLLVVAAPAHAVPGAVKKFHGPHFVSGDGLQVTMVRYRRSASQGVDEAEALFDEGQYEFDSQDFRAATKVFERLVDEYPNSEYALKAQRYLATIYKRLDRQPRRFKHIGRNPTERRSLPPPREHLSVRPDKPRKISRAPIAPRMVRPDAQMQRKLLLNVGDRVFFAANSKRIGAKARTVLRRQAIWLRKNPELRVRIEGHSHDNSGNHNDLILSLRRAEVVRDRLVEEGVEAERISVFGRGRASPVAICDSAMCAAQNRRVVTIVYRHDREDNRRHRASLPQPRR